MLGYSMEILSMKTKNGKTVKALKPDSSGFYRNLPMLVIGKGSRNCDYEVESLKESIFGVDSTFRKRVEECNCEGEQGHPFFAGPPEVQFARLFYIDKTRTSHNIFNVKPIPLSGGNILVVADIKPSGPYEETLKKSLQDPDINTAFSMRVFCHPPTQQPNGRLLKKVREFVTIDSESTPGWEEASKRYIPSAGDSGLETLHSQYCQISDMVKIVHSNITLGHEAANNQLFDILQTDEVVLENKSYIIDRLSNKLFDKTGKIIHPFHAFYNTEKGV